MLMYSSCYWRGSVSVFTLRVFERVPWLHIVAVFTVRCTPTPSAMLSRVLRGWMDGWRPGQYHLLLRYKKHLDDSTVGETPTAAVNDKLNCVFMTGCNGSKIRHSSCTNLLLSSVNQGNVT